MELWQILVGIALATAAGGAAAQELGRRRSRPLAGAARPRPPAVVLPSAEETAESLRRFRAAALRFKQSDFDLMRAAYAGLDEGGNRVYPSGAVPTEESR